MIASHSMYVSRCILALIYVLLFPAFAFASSTVSPLVIDHTTEARGLETDTVVFTNTGSGRAVFFPTVNNISIGANGGIESFIAPSMSDKTASLSSWLELSRKPTTLNPGEHSTTTLTLRVSPTAAPGVYHALIAFPDGENRDVAEARVQRGEVPGTVVTVTIEKKVREGADLGVFNVDRFIWSDQNNAVTYTIKNNGDTNVRPTGDIIIYTSSGLEAVSIPVNPDGKEVMHGESLTLTANVPLHSLFGKYKAYLRVHYGTQGAAELQDTAYFYAAPWKKFVALFGGTMLIGLALILLLHRRYGGGGDEDVADHLPLHVKDGVSGAVHHDIDMKPRI